VVVALVLVDMAIDLIDVALDVVGVALTLVESALTLVEVAVDVVDVALDWVDVAVDWVDVALDGKLHDKVTLRPVKIGRLSVHGTGPGPAPPTHPPGPLHSVGRTAMASSSSSGLQTPANGGGGDIDVMMELEELRQMDTWKSLVGWVRSNLSTSARQALSHHMSTPCQPGKTMVRVHR